MIRTGLPSAMKKKRRRGKKKRMTGEQLVALNYVNEWMFEGNCAAKPDDASDDFGFSSAPTISAGPVFEFHSHSNHSDGFLSPAKLVEKAHADGVQVLALTDHDTMSGIHEAVIAARKFGIKIIPGVEISTMFSPKEAESEESVHILAYYGSFGPKQFHKIDGLLSNIRDGRFVRAESIISKLNDLKLHIKWDHVANIAGKGVAPGRLHVARAMVEAGHVENVQQAFAHYLYNGGPAYSTGSEPSSEEAVEVICKTGGVAVLAHPWVLKNPVPIIMALKAAGLHGLEVYRRDEKIEVLCSIADSFGLLKLGGSDFHGKQVHGESDLGSVSLSLLSIYNFLKVARPIWSNATLDILKRFTEELSDANIEDITRFGNAESSHHLHYCMSHSSTEAEGQSLEMET